MCGNRTKGGICDRVRRGSRAAMARWALTGMMQECYRGFVINQEVKPVENLTEPHAPTIAVS